MFEIIESSREDFEFFGLNYEDFLFSTEKRDKFDYGNVLTNAKQSSNFTISK